MKKSIAMLLSMLFTIQVAPITVQAESNLVDSDINYTESVNTINNPGAGYTSTVWYVCKPGNTPVKNPQGNLVVLFVDIGAFSSGVNGTTDDDGNYTEGTDYDLDESFFNGLRGTLENCRKNGCTVGIRFRYDANGKTNPEPATFDKVLEHIQQIKDNGVLDDYEDILMYVESGFVGAWGEQHSGKYTSLEYKAQLLDAMLDMIPKSVSVTVRTPNTFCKWAGIDPSEISSYVAEKGSDAARVGLFNDGYMGSDTDLGTFISPNRAESVTWMKTQMQHTYYGGEFSGSIDYAQKYDTYLPENSIQEMYYTHLSYINSNIWSLYKDYTFSEEYDMDSCNNSAYYGQTVYQFMRDHIGYRFVLRDSDLTAETEQGGTVTVDFKVENTGFASPIKEQNAQVLLEKDGYYMICDSDIDDRDWQSTSTTEENINIKLPDNIDAGDWNVYLKLSVGDTDAESAFRTVQFANENIYNDSIGANYLGTVTVDTNSNVGTDNSFYEEGAESKSDSTIYNYNGKINIDGVISEREWLDENLLAESEDSKLYVTSDKDYLYVAMIMPNTATSPVYNLQWKGIEDTTRMWTYYQSNGFVYFSGTDNSGIVCKYNGGTAEFKIPLTENMNLSQGKELEYIRGSIQDSSNSWVAIGDIRTTNYTIYSQAIGDVNSDGNCDISDLVALQKWILKYPISDIRLDTANLNEDDLINAFDLCLLKQTLGIS